MRWIIDSLLPFPESRPRLQVPAGAANLGSFKVDKHYPVEPTKALLARSGCLRGSKSSPATQPPATRHCHHTVFGSRLATSPPPPFRLFASHLGPCAATHALDTSAHARPVSVEHPYRSPMVYRLSTKYCVRSAVHGFRSEPAGLQGLTAPAATCHVKLADRRRFRDQHVWHTSVELGPAGTNSHTCGSTSDSFSPNASAQAVLHVLAVSLRSRIIWELETAALALCFPLHSSQVRSERTPYCVCVSTFR